MKKPHLLLISAFLLSGALMACDNTSSSSIGSSSSSSVTTSTSSTPNSTPGTTSSSTPAPTTSTPPPSTPSTSVNEKMKKEVLTIASLPVGNITSATKFGSNDFFTLNGKTDKFLTVEAQAATVGDVRYEQSIKTNGSSSITSAEKERTIAFTTTGKGTLKVIAKSGSTGVQRKITLAYGANNRSYKEEVLGDEAIAYSFDFYKSGTYYLHSIESSVRYFHIEVEYEDGVEAEEPEIEITLTDNNVLNVGELPAGNIEKAMTAGNFTILPRAESDTGAHVSIEGNSKTFDGTAYGQRLKLGGAVATGVRGIQFTITKAATIYVAALSSSSSAVRSGIIINSAGETVKQADVLGASTVGINYELTDPGTYTFGSLESGINVYCFSILYPAA